MSPSFSTKTMKWLFTSASASGAAVCPPWALASEAVWRSFASASMMPMSSGVLPSAAARNLPKGESADKPRASALFAKLWIVAMVPQALPTYCLRCFKLGLIFCPLAWIAAFCSAFHFRITSRLESKSKVTATAPGGTIASSSSSRPKMSVKAQLEGIPTCCAKSVSISGLDSKGTQWTFFILSRIEASHGVHSSSTSAISLSRPPGGKPGGHVATWKSMLARAP
mmetsp:Transcript_80189/g.217224  ORF Transcript_80189/g.217224 Transcript_80189/m.217224 type:complete len:225 (-) Transcript_80189:7-681(-)